MDIPGPKRARLLQVLRVYLEQLAIDVSDREAGGHPMRDKPPDGDLAASRGRGKVVVKNEDNFSNQDACAKEIPDVDDSLDYDEEHTGQEPPGNDSGTRRERQTPEILDTPAPPVPAFSFGPPKKEEKPHLHPTTSVSVNNKKRRHSNVDHRDAESAPPDLSDNADSRPAKLRKDESEPPAETGTALVVKHKFSDKGGATTAWKN